MLAFSRILNDQEIVVAANTSESQALSVEIIIEQQLTQSGDILRLLYSNQTEPAAPAPVTMHAAGTVQVAEVDGSTGRGPLHTVRVTLAPMEVQIIGR